MSDDSFTRAQAVQGTAPATDLDYSSMSAEDLLQHMMAGPAAEHREKAEVKALYPVMLAYTHAEPLDTGLPPAGEEELHPNHWLVVHRGVSHAAVHKYNFPVSNFYNIFVYDAAGKPFTTVIASGLNWIHKDYFYGAFDDPRDSLLAKAHAAGILEIIPPGMPLDVRTLSPEFLEKMAHGAAQLCTDPRTLRFIAHLAGGVNKGWLLRKADDLETDARKEQKHVLNPKTVGEFAAAANK